MLPRDGDELRGKLRPFLLLAALGNMFRTLATRAVDAGHLAASVLEYQEGSEVSCIHAPGPAVPAPRLLSFLLLPQERK